jgi:hypothetical protein
VSRLIARRLTLLGKYISIALIPTFWGRAVVEAMMKILCEIVLLVLVYVRVVMSLIKDETVVVSLLVVVWLSK